jgi:hypothetical protein
MGKNGKNFNGGYSHLSYLILMIRFVRRFSHHFVSVWLIMTLFIKRAKTCFEKVSRKIRNKILEIENDKYKCQYELLYILCKKLLYILGYTKMIKYVIIILVQPRIQSISY